MDSAFNEQIELELRNRLKELLPQLEKHFRSHLQKEAQEEVDRFKEEFAQQAQTRMQQLLQQLKDDHASKLQDKQTEVDRKHKQCQKAQRELQQARNEIQQLRAEKQNSQNKLGHAQNYKFKLIQQRKDYELQHQEMSRYVAALQQRAPKQNLLSEKSWLEESKDFINLKEDDDERDHSRRMAVRQTDKKQESGDAKEMTKQILLSMIKQKYF